MAATNYVCAEYIWIDAEGGYRSKTKVVHGKTSVTVDDLPNWNYDGSSTMQAAGDDSEVTIVPRAVYPDPFRRGSNHVLVMTDTYAPSGAPLVTNSRNLAAKIFAEQPEQVPWYGIEQEYTMFQDGRPLGWPKSKARALNNSPTSTFGYPAAQGPYYCAAGADRIFGREIVEEHLDACNYAGINISGINAEVMPGQWEYQVGPNVGISAGDDMSVSRYILNRVAEKYKVKISYHPKPIPGDWNGAGCHTNFSTAPMREAGGYEKAIIPAIECLKKKHQRHINAYGADNDQRLTGKHETGSILEFSWGVADRGCSIRVGNDTAKEGKGYLEDRRPASNMDPYIVSSLIYDTCVLDSKYEDEFDNIKTTGSDFDSNLMKEPKVEAIEEGDALESLEKLGTVAAVKKKKKKGCKTQ